MAILGLHPSHDSGAVVLDESGKILSAINEERLNGEKLFWGFPEKSIPKALELAGRNVDDVSAVAVGGRTPMLGKQEAFDMAPTRKKLVEYLGYLPVTGTTTFARFAHRLLLWFRSRQGVERRIRELGLDAPIHFYDHHRCHAASAYYTSPFDSDTLVLTMDSAGENRSATVYTVDRDHSLRLQSWTPFYHSLGKYWVYVTYNLGFTPGRHEGKITGLAAQGDPEESLPVFRKYIDFNEKTLRFRSNIGRWNNPAAARLHEELRGINWTDIAAGLQARTNEVVTGLVDSAMRRFDCSNLVLAGGVAANVNLNNHLRNLDTVDDIFIHPHMGDGGLGTGAAYVHRAETMRERGEEPKPRFISTVYLGTSHGEDEMEQALQEAGVEYTRPDEPDAAVGELLAEGYVVGRYAGSMEYGPRALGNRSVLLAPTDPSCQTWLNKRMDRTEFMPFAPSILREHADEFLRDTTSGMYAGRFMTINFDVTDTARQMAPAVVHVDGTCRPQIVRKEDNAGYHRVIESLHEHTGLPIVLNTSFNAHGSPIVSTPTEAIEAYEKGMVDVLSLGPFVARRPGERPSIRPSPIEFVEDILDRKQSPRMEATG